MPAQPKDRRIEVRVSQFQLELLRYMAQKDRRSLSNYLLYAADVYSDYCRHRRQTGEEETPENLMSWYVAKNP